MNLLVLILLTCIVMTYTMDISMVRSKLSACKDFEVLPRDSTDLLIDDFYQCMIDTRLFRINKDLIDHYFRDSIDNYKNAIHAYEKLNHEMIQFDRDSRRKLRAIQRNIVGIRMNVLYLIAESELPPLTHLSNEREIRRVKEYLLTNEKTLDYLKSVPMMTYIGQLQNITHYTDDLSDAIALRDSTKRTIENTKRTFIDLILEEYVL